MRKKKEPEEKVENVFETTLNILAKLNQSLEFLTQPTISIKSSNKVLNGTIK